MKRKVTLVIGLVASLVFYLVTNSIVTRRSGTPFVEQPPRSGTPSVAQPPKLVSDCAEAVRKAEGCAKKVLRDDAATAFDCEVLFDAIVASIDVEVLNECAVTLWRINGALYLKQQHATETALVEDLPSIR